MPPSNWFLSENDLCYGVNNTQGLGRLCLLWAMFLILSSEFSFSFFIVFRWVLWIQFNQFLFQLWVGLVESCERIVGWYRRRRRCRRELPRLPSLIVGCWWPIYNYFRLELRNCTVFRYFEVLLCSPWYFLYFEVLWGTSMYFGGTSWYSEVLLATSGYFEVLLHTSWYIGASSWYFQRVPIKIREVLKNSG